MKYKIGELVQLSAAGAKCNHNYGYYDGYGMITKYVKGSTFPYKIRWFGSEHGHKCFEAKEYELKRYRMKQ